MRSFLGGLFAICAFILVLVAWGQSSFGMGAPWALGAIALLLAAAAIWPLKSPTSDRSDDEDLAAKENNRKVAMQLAEAGGMLGIVARQWLSAYEKDPSVPIFGVRPYWTPTGPGGTPQLLSMIGLRGVEARLEYVRQAEADDTLLPIMAHDPNRRVRDAARARMGSSASFLS